MGNEGGAKGRIGSRKMKGFAWSSVLGIVAFIILVIKMPPEQLMTLCQFYFGFQTVTTATFFGGNAVEHWSDKKAMSNQQPSNEQ